MTKFLCAFLFLFQAYANCVHEMSLTGKEIKAHPKRLNFLIENKDARFIPYHNFFEDLNDLQKYDIQIQHVEMKTESSEGYNDRYLKYYSYERLENYLNSQEEELLTMNYEISIIGKSIRGLNLYHIAPKKIDQNKKLILMFGRHHGDEGTANWIIEGFLDNFMTNKEFRDQYQLVLYPMVNPDGAKSRTRYNANGRDLNRVWDTDYRKSKDEIGIIQGHFLSNYRNPVIMLDMHGSFTEDFIYRVDRNFKGRDFYNTQQSFIDTLSSFDPYQNGNYYTSNGHRKMSRIYFVNKFNINALTHETPRDIKKNGDRGIKELKSQGIALIETIKREL